MKSLPLLKQKIDAISPSFCAAKWKQVTLHLATGHTHSCHHVQTHQIPLDEIKIDVSALHNTKFKKEQRAHMLNGIRPEECSYCWNVEDSNENAISDRILKSNDAWAEPYVNEIATSKSLSADPSYLEVSFSSVCNLKCSYCSPEVSSKWMEEISIYGPYPTSAKYNNKESLIQRQKMPIPEREHNPYVDAFWEWLPKLHKSLKVLRITGGEPLLSKHTMTLLTYLLDNPTPELDLSVNSNLCVPEELFNNFTTVVQQLLERQCIKSFTMFTSCEANGKKAEYIRYGLDYDLWLTRCDEVLKTIKNSKLIITSTYNALSVTSFTEFLQHVYDLKIRHAADRVIIDVPYLRYPTHLSFAILPKEYLSQVEEQITFMQNHMTSNNWVSKKIGYSEYEIYCMKKNYDVFKSYTERAVPSAIDRSDFAIFVEEHDRRRGTNFLETFPEFTDFLELCKNARPSSRQRQR